MGGVCLTHKRWERMHAYLRMHISDHWTWTWMACRASAQPRMRRKGECVITFTLNLTLNLILILTLTHARRLSRRALRRRA